MAVILLPRCTMTDETTANTSAPLKDAIKSLKLKYVEQQDKFNSEHQSLSQQLQDLQEQNDKKDRQLESLKAENGKLENEVARLVGGYQ